MKLSMKNWKPIFIENSKLLKILNVVTPINTWAMTLGFIVLCKGEMDEVTRQHETIHFQQFLETGFIGFLVFYVYDYIKCYLATKDAQVSYYRIRAEQEAYDCQDVQNYLSMRKRWVWLRRYEI
jgi:hypothetical protein